LSSLRNRLNLSSQNWAKERDDFAQREAFAREEFESAKQAMQDWEVLAMEERSIRENLGERVAELEEQVATLRESNQSLETERSTQALNVDGLQRALRELQDGEYNIGKVTMLTGTSTKTRASRDSRKLAESSPGSSKAPSGCSGDDEQGNTVLRSCTKRA
jgi:chromosome segregation ATPase